MEVTITIVHKEYHFTVQY